MHKICRLSKVYSMRMLVPDEKAPWNVHWPTYVPPVYTAPHLKEQSWADPEIENSNFNPKWNQLDNGLDRHSYEDGKQIPYDIVNGYPLNPKGRTGLQGRGRLGRWGPNHAGDAIITRWKPQEKSLNESINSQTLQFIGILRRDCKQWAIPGGFVNPNESGFDAAIREFCEEALNHLKTSLPENIKNFFAKGKECYKGYVDDPRNTDNAWIETTAVNFHDEEGKVVEEFNLEAGDDAAAVKWIDIVPNMDIYPCHLDIITLVANKLKEGANV